MTKHLFCHHILDCYVSTLLQIPFGTLCRINYELTDPVSTIHSKILKAAHKDRFCCFAYLFHFQASGRWSQPELLFAAEVACRRPYVLGTSRGKVGEGGEGRGEV